MTLPPPLLSELNELVETRDSYYYRGDEIGDKTIICLIAPSATGKSTVITEVLRQCKRQDLQAGEANSIATRARRADGSDPIGYRTASEGITHQQLVKRIRAGQLVNWSLFATGDLYATDALSYPFRYNFLPMQPDSLAMLQKAGFKAVIPIYLVAPLAEWQTRLQERQGDSKFHGRIAEAITSLEFARQRSGDLHIIDNPSALRGMAAHPQATAERIIDIVVHDTPIDNEPEALKNLDEMLTYARQLHKDLSGSA